MENKTKRDRFLFVFIILIITLTIGLSGCSSELEDEIESLEDKLEKSNKENKKLEAKNKEIMEIIATYEDLYGELEIADNIDEELDKSDNGSGKSNAIKEIEIGEKVVIEDYCEFTISSMDFTQKVEPSNSDSYYSYYEVDDPKEIYLNTVLNFKNTSTISLEVRDIIDVKLLYDDKYNYNSFTVGESPGGGNFEMFLKLDPLKETRTHSIAEIPIEISENEKPLSVIISIYNNTYKVNLR